MSAFGVYLGFSMFSVVLLAYLGCFEPLFRVFGYFGLWLLTFRWCFGYCFVGVVFLAGLLGLMFWFGFDGFGCWWVLGLLFSGVG